MKLSLPYPFFQEWARLSDLLPKNSEWMRKKEYDYSEETWQALPQPSDQGEAVKLCAHEVPANTMRGVRHFSVLVF